MKASQFFIIVLLTTCLCVPSFAKSKGFSEGSPTSPQTIVLGGLGLPIWAGGAGISFNGGIVHSFFPTAKDLYLGGDFAVDILSVLGLATGVAIHILPTGMYRIHLDGTNKWILNGGLSFGPVVGSAVTYALLLRPGAEFIASDVVHLQFELKMGLVGGGFYFRPNVSWVWYF